MLRIGSRSSLVGEEEDVKEDGKMNGVSSSSSSSSSATPPSINSHAQQQFDEPRPHQPNSRRHSNGKGGAGGGRSNSANTPNSGRGARRSQSPAVNANVSNYSLPSSSSFSSSAATQNQDGNESLPPTFNVRVLPVKAPILSLQRLNSPTNNLSTISSSTTAPSLYVPPKFETVPKVSTSASSSSPSVVASNPPRILSKRDSLSEQLANKNDGNVQQSTSVMHNTQVAVRPIVSLPSASSSSSTTAANASAPLPFPNLVNKTSPKILASPRVQQATTSNAPAVAAAPATVSTGAASFGLASSSSASSSSASTIAMQQVAPIVINTSAFASPFAISSGIFSDAFSNNAFSNNSSGNSLVNSKAFEAFSSPSSLNFSAASFTPSSSSAAFSSASALTTNEATQGPFKLCASNLRLVNSDAIERILSQSTSFTTIAVLGLPNVGKSTIMNALVDSSEANKAFAVHHATSSAAASNATAVASASSSERSHDRHKHRNNAQASSSASPQQTVPLNATVGNLTINGGVDLMLTSRHLLALDSQPLPLLEVTSDISSTASSLALTIFLLSISHVLLVVCEWPISPSLVHAVKHALILHHQLYTNLDPLASVASLSTSAVNSSTSAAPSTSSSSSAAASNTAASNSNTSSSPSSAVSVKSNIKESLPKSRLAAHTPELIIVINKLKDTVLDNMSPIMMQQVVNDLFADCEFIKRSSVSNLHAKVHPHVSLFVVPYHDPSSSASATSASADTVAAPNLFNAALTDLRRQVLAIWPATTLSTPHSNPIVTEKDWFRHVNTVLAALQSTYPLNDKRLLTNNHHHNNNNNNNNINNPHAHQNHANNRRHSHSNSNSRNHHNNNHNHNANPRHSSGSNASNSSHRSFNHHNHNHAHSQANALSMEDISDSDYQRDSPARSVLDLYIPP